MTIKIEGLDELNKKLKSADEKTRESLRTTLQRICRDLKGKAQRITPVDQGDLQGSAYYETQINSSGVDGEVGFEAVYATRQHEELTWRHLFPGQAKYLEQPLQENLPKYIQALEKTTMGSLEGK